MELDDDFMNEPVYTIGLAADKLGVAVPTLRMYEQAGLILPYRTKTQRRLYSRNDVKRIQVIIDLIRNHRLNIESIRVLCALAPCWRIVNCSPDIRNKCEAFTDETTPCWLLHEKACSRSEADCRTCEVYLSCPKTIQHPKEFLKKFMEA